MCVVENRNRFFLYDQVQIFFHVGNYNQKVKDNVDRLQCVSIESV